VFFRKEAGGVPYDKYARYRIDPDVYRQEYLLFKNQPWWVLRELRTIKILMAVLIPLFVVLSFISTHAAAIGGLITAGILGFIFKKKNDARPAAAAAVSVLLGAVFGYIFRLLIFG
jgi:hypothetical protein